MSESLKPCPFCGKAEPKYGFVGMSGEHWIECGDSGCAMGIVRSSKDDAIAAWNKRSPDALAGQLYEALKDVMNGNDLALERNHSIENWRNSDFRKKATAAIRAYEERAK